jgi:hypothetical protein
MSDKKCRFCDAGDKLVGDNHWIVTSIIPAKIKLMRCEKLPKSSKHHPVGFTTASPSSPKPDDKPA